MSQRMSQRMIQRSIVIILVGLAAAAFIFWKWIGVKPTALSDLEYVTESLQNLAPDYDVAEVQDIVEVDSRHLFVPFVSGSGEHGMSFWVWDRFEWELRSVESSGNPYLWRLRGDDPAGQYIVWNADPASRIGEYAFYWIRPRNGGRSDGEDFYVPRVQLEQKFSLGDRTYDAVPLPEEWAELQRLQLAAHKGTDAPGLWGWGASTPGSYTMGYIPVLSGEPEEESAWSSKGTTFGDIDLQFVSILNERDLEGRISGR